MLKVQEWAEIRRLHKVEGLSQRAIAERLGLNRRTVTKVLAPPAPPRYPQDYQFVIGHRAAQSWILTNRRFMPCWRKTRSGGRCVSWN
jgi:transcriptional regulator with XRE-family HTH domain